MRKSQTIRTIWKCTRNSPKQTQMNKVLQNNWFLIHAGTFGRYVVNISIESKGTQIRTRLGDEPNVDPTNKGKIENFKRISNFDQKWTYAAMKSYVLVRLVE